MIDHRDGDGRLFAPTFARNSEPILSALLPLIAGLAGAAVEIGCGSGQHASALAAARPDMTVLPTDIFAEHRTSAAAHAAADGLRNMAAPRALDAAGPWAETIADLGPLALVLAINVVHITPWVVVEGLFRGAGQVLGTGGVLVLYGPFIEPDRPLDESNAAFDASLKARNPAWGIRALTDLDRLARGAGLGSQQIARLPANNMLVNWRRG